MSYAIFHAEKGKGSGTSLGHHIDRTEGKEHTYLHADPSLKRLNIDYTPKGFKSIPLDDAINSRIKEGYKGVKEIRKDAVKYLSMVFTSDKEGMELIQKAGVLEDWIKANEKFIQDEFGEDNVVRMTLHLDETTPHLHCVVVPLTKDGRLSAKEVMGNKINLQERQDRYAEAMEPFGLERGVKGSRAVHDGVVEYQTRVTEGLKIIHKTEPLSLSMPEHKPYQIPTPPLTAREKWAEEQNKAIREHQINLITQTTLNHQKAFTEHLNDLQNKFIAMKEKYEKLKKGKEEEIKKGKSAILEVRENLQKKYPQEDIKLSQKGPKRSF